MCTYICVYTHVYTATSHSHPGLDTWSLGIAHTEHVFRKWSSKEWDFLGMAFPRPGPPFEGYGMRSKSLTACVHIPWSMHSECKGQDFSTSRTQSLEKGMETYPQGLVCRA